MAHFFGAKNSSKGKYTTLISLTFIIFLSLTIQVKKQLIALLFEH
ncbi:hypothetical protein FORMB_19750 [Formosa sp. Hel1_33_131]|nr:hypothetical protein FORMB_19750 [Formosa sp. Hel1_33_131]